MDATPVDGATLAINVIAVVVSLATLVLVAVATVRLYKKAHIRGSGYMLAALAGAIGGIPAFLAYLAVVGPDAGREAEDLFNLYEVSCVAFGAFGYWRLSKSILERGGDQR